MDPRFKLAFECQENWDAMAEVAPGERRCDKCSESVVDLSRLRKSQALAIVTSPSPPCVSYLVRGDTVVFARETVGGRLAMAAAGLLAACASPTAAEPACELGPEPVETSVAEPSLLDPGLPSTPFALEPVGAPTPPPRVIAAQNGGPRDHARAGDPNDLDGVDPNGGTGHVSPASYPSRVRGRIPSHYFRTRNP